MLEHDWILMDMRNYARLSELSLNVLGRHHQQPAHALHAVASGKNCCSQMSAQQRDSTTASSANMSPRTCWITEPAAFPHCDYCPDDTTILAGPSCAHARLICIVEGLLKQALRCKNLLHVQPSGGILTSA
jgi:hypothetical protein